MKKTLKYGMLASALGIMIGMAGEASAYTFDFQNEYYVSSSSEFSSLFPGATGYGTAGIYQETNTTTPTVTKLASSGAPGEFQQNTATNASQGLQLFGWSGSYNNGYPLLNNVYNSTNPYNGSVLYMQYKTGVTGGLFGNGTTTAFNLNSIQFRGATTNANLTFTLEGLDLSNNVLDTAILTVTGNTFQTFTENWSGVDTLEIVSTVANPINWGSGTLYLGGVEINDPIATPEPGTMVLLGLGMAGLAIYGKRRMNTKA